MRRYCAVELPAEAFYSQGFECPRIQLVGQPALIPERESVAVVKNDIGVGGIFEPSIGTCAARNIGIGTIHQPRPYRSLRILLGGESFSTYPSVAIGRLAI